MDDWLKHEFSLRRDRFHFHYILDELNRPVAVDLLEMVRWVSTHNVHVGDTHIGPYRVSTVFLGIDHSMQVSNTHIPVLFETMIFDRRTHKPALDYEQRYRTWALAEQGHQEAVTFVLEQLKANNLLHRVLGRLPFGTRTGFADGGATGGAVDG